MVILALLACQSVNPDVGRFQCSTAADCGPGWECWPHFTGGGRCFRAGECTADEVCDGVDQNCDGQIDEVFPGEGVDCATGAPGPCAPGVTVCDGGSLGCAALIEPQAEQCNHVDDDCDGVSDEDFDTTTDPLNCGECLMACDAGTVCQSSACVPQ